MTRYDIVYRNFIYDTESEGHYHIIAESEAEALAIFHNTFVHSSGFVILRVNVVTGGKDDS